eukprot:4775214-Prymnesium_polylepis.1
MPHLLPNIAAPTLDVADLLPNMAAPTLIWQARAKMSAHTALPSHILPPPKGAAVSAAGAAAKLKKKARPKKKPLPG